MARRRAHQPLEALGIAALDLAVAHLDRTGHGLEARALRRLKDKVLALVPRNRMARIETDHDALLEAQGFGEIDTAESGRRMYTDINRVLGRVIRPANGTRDGN